MLGSFARLLAILFRERRTDMQLGVRYRLTLDLEEIRQSMPQRAGRSAGDVQSWLMKMGLMPTSKDNIWKGEQHMLRSVPKAAVLKAEKL